MSGENKDFAQLSQPQKIETRDGAITPFGIFRSRQSFAVSLLAMSTILGFYHQWYAILAEKPQDFVLTFYRNFPMTTLESIIRLLPLLVPFYLLLSRFREWSIWKRLLLFALLALGTTLIEEFIEYYMPGFNNAKNDTSNPRFLAFLSFDMIGDILLFFGIISALGYVDHILCKNHILFTRLSEEKSRLAEEEQLRLMAELEALQSQINPHFLFNTLNSLATLVVTNPEKAELLIRDMSDWYRDTLRTTQQKSWTIQDEIELIQNYLRIESVRLEERLTVNIQCAKKALKIAIPPLVLQPLVENAVQHGIAPSVSGGTVSVNIEGDAQHFSLSVEDSRHDCDSVEENHSAGTGSGLQNIKRRLELAFGKDLQFHFNVGDRGAIASITVNRGCDDGS
ncbi:hypothetical protein MNBD_NITROSPIRAE01-1623 [hydrothermal vent metagenome]|uniref:Signal transduction histidine kinase internal region domain-containing protein n=1 Tax=hydrothermal vent metagenome TaxID=652676 RepID=A0A3B1CKU5_9ZZZZ